MLAQPRPRGAAARFRVFLGKLCNANSVRAGKPPRHCPLYASSRRRSSPLELRLVEVSAPGPRSPISLAHRTTADETEPRERDFSGGNLPVVPEPTTMFPVLLHGSAVLCARSFVRSTIFSSCTMTRSERACLRDRWKER